MLKHDFTYPKVKSFYFYLYLNLKQGCLNINRLRTPVLIQIWDESANLKSCNAKFNMISLIKKLDVSFFVQNLNKILQI